MEAEQQDGLGSSVGGPKGTGVGERESCRRDGWMVEYRKGGKEGHLEYLPGAKGLQQEDCVTTEERNERGRERKKTNTKKGGGLKAHQEFAF